MAAYFLLSTNDEIVPSAPLNDLPHPVIVSSGEGVAEEEDDDEVDVVTEVHEHREEAQISVGEIFSQRHLCDGEEQAGNCRAMLSL